MKTPGVYNDTRDIIGPRLRERAFIVKLTNLFDFQAHTRTRGFWSLPVSGLQ